MVPMRLALPLTILCISATATAADETSDKLCPILSSVAAQSVGAIPEMAQAFLVIAVASAYDEDHDALANVLETADASATAACPEARTAILAATKKPSLNDAMR